MATLAVRVLVTWPSIPSSPGLAWRKLMYALIPVVVLETLVRSVPPPLELRWSWADLFALALLAVLVVIGVLGAISFDEDLAKTFQFKWGSNTFDLKRGVVAALGVWLLIAPLSFVAHAIVGAEAVQDGRRQRASLFGVPFPWQVAVANVAWKDAKSQPPQTRGCLLYLGGSGNVAVFYDPHGRRSVQVPTADVIITVFPEKRSC